MAKDMFITIGGCDGESTDKNHEKWIEIEGFTWGVSQASAGSVSTGGARTSERVQHDPFTFTARIDASAARLLKVACQGKHIDKATIDLLRATGDGNSTLYQQFVLENLVVAGLHINAGEPGSLPLVTVNLNYAKITWTYTEMDHKTGAKKGNITANHDLSLNTVA